MGSRGCGPLVSSSSQRALSYQASLYLKSKSSPSLPTLQCPGLLFGDYGEFVPLNTLAVYLGRSAPLENADIIVIGWAFHFMLADDSCLSLMINRRIESDSSLRSVTHYCKDKNMPGKC